MLITRFCYHIQFLNDFNKIYFRLLSVQPISNGKIKIFHLELLDQKYILLNKDFAKVF